MRLDKFIPLLTAILVISSCSDIDDRDFADERFYTSSHASAVSSVGGSTGLVALDASILSYLMAGESSTDEFGLKAVDIAFDLRSNDLDMSGSTWFGGYHRYDNVLPNSNDTEHLWEFFYKVIKTTFEMSHCNSFIYMKTFKLMKHWCMRLVTVTSVGSSWHNNFKRWFARQHRSNLNW